MFHLYSKEHILFSKNNVVHVVNRLLDFPPLAVVRELYGAVWFSVGSVWASHSMFSVGSVWA